MATVLLLPNQLFKHKYTRVVLWEHPEFFNENFSKVVLLYRWVCLQNYKKELEGNGVKVKYVRYDGSPSPGNYDFIEPANHQLEKQLKKLCGGKMLKSPQFLLSKKECEDYKVGKRLLHASFYKYMRRKFDLLMKADQPLGGHWSYDTENRLGAKKHKGALPDDLRPITQDLKAARHYLESNFPGAIGPSYEEALIHFPTTRSSARAWLRKFFDERLSRFGPYEDSIFRGHHRVYHAAISPMLNNGLLVPEDVLTLIRAAPKGSATLQSLEGFTRQIIGWREYMRMTYAKYGKNTSALKKLHGKKLGKEFYKATTGVPPVDDAIRSVLATGYAHHIRRLMVLGVYMRLNNVHPMEIYRWFSELFVDAYPWVMWSNVLGMSQYVLRVPIVRKLYLCSSAYILRMSDYKRGPWCGKWDSLYRAAKK
ncbi:deoxyribodipyrimidine photolyase-related protein [Kaumoebavirus]|uniref:deoxyribodipyrimidine photolyase-related protein n=1 Tax=Kaumoebavirus TaxID=1859492 RepID=UPI0009C33C5C|nr:deoxyribodipyrimidine photolyase-related protein [Kaumoebavirus]ARA72233.1 deoxyribodipyrimidine photolyase-related protein [Kaumoebavirus]